MNIEIFKSYFKMNTNLTVSLISPLFNKHTCPSKFIIIKVISLNPYIYLSGDQPRPPSGLKAVTMSSSAILLSWEPVFSPASSPIQAYTVHYKPTKGMLNSVNIILYFFTNINPIWY